MRVLGIKSRREIAREMLTEPAVIHARRAIREGDRVLHEIEALERRQ